MIKNFLAFVMMAIISIHASYGDATRYIDYGGKIPSKGPFDLRLDYTTSGARTLEITVYNSSATLFSKSIYIARFGDGNGNNSTYSNWLTIGVTVPNIASSGIAPVGSATLRIRIKNGSTVTYTATVPVNIQSGKQGFHIYNGNLYDGREVTFIPRGINNPNIYADDGTGTSERYIAYHELDNIRKDGHANAVRIVWKTDNYFSKNWVTGATAPLGQRISGPANSQTSSGENIYNAKTSGYPGILKLEKIIQKCIEQKMIPVLELHDVTGNATSAGGDPNYLKLMAQFWADNVWLLIKYRQYVVVNIANEWSTNAMISNLHPGLQKWRNAYIESIRIIRDAGFSGTLVVDAPAYAQAISALTYGDWPRSGDCSGCSISTQNSYAQSVLNNDPFQNVMFSLHMYAEWATSVASSTCGQYVRYNIASELQNIKNRNIPFMVGEFGHKHDGSDKDGSYRTLPIDYRLIMRECVKHGFGFFAWSWFGNGSGVEYLDVASGFNWSTIYNGSNFADQHSGNPYVMSETYKPATLSTNSGNVTMGSCSRGGGGWGTTLVNYYDAAYNTTTYNNGNFGLGRPGVSKICSIFDASQPAARVSQVEAIAEVERNSEGEGFVYPNPISSIGHVTHKIDAGGKPVHLTVSNQSGAVVFRKTYIASVEEEVHSLQIDLSECNACTDGLYYYHINSTSETLSGKLMIRR